MDTLREAKAFISATRADVERGVYIATDTTTVRQACASFVANRALRVREVTARSYESALGHAVDAFGDKRLQHLTRRDAERLRDDMTRAGRSGRTVGLTLMLLRSVLAEAQADGLVVRNVAARVEGPSQAPQKREALSGEEVAKISAAAEGHRLSGCWLLSLSGLRRSEVLGLRWSDLDDDGALRVERGRVDVDGRGHTVVGPTKTRAGVRTLPLPPHMRKALAVMRTRRDEEMLALGRKVSGDDHLATDEIGPGEVLGHVAGVVRRGRGAEGRAPRRPAHVGHGDARQGRAGSHRGRVARSRRGDDAADVLARPGGLARGRG